LTAKARWVPCPELSAKLAVFTATAIVTAIRGFLYVTGVLTINTQANAGHRLSAGNRNGFIAFLAFSQRLTFRAWPEAYIGGVADLAKATSLGLRSAPCIYALQVTQRHRILVQRLPGAYRPLSGTALFVFFVFLDIAWHFA
jgi:hypothetical protein